MANLIDTATRLVYLGETGHIGNGDPGPWEAWASDARLTLTEIGACIEGFTAEFSRGEISGKEYAQVIAPYSTVRERLRDAFAARDAASIAWPTWGGVDHELARFDSRLIPA